MSIRPGEIVRRGTVVQVESRVQLAAEAARGVAVAGQRVPVELSEDRRTIRVDTSRLPVGPHVLRVEEMWTQRSRERLDDLDVPFVVIDTAAPLPDDIVIQHAGRLRIGEYEPERLVLDGAQDGPYVDVFKAERRDDGEPVQLAYDERGEPIDLDRELAAQAERRASRFGKTHPALHEAVERAGPGESVPVAIWLADPAEERADKPTRGQVRRRPTTDDQSRRRWQSATEQLIETARGDGLEPDRVDEAAPIVYGRMPAAAVARLAARDDVAAVFLHEREGFVDLGDSIAIAAADDAHAAGATGAGVNVAVYEDGPDDTSNLSITDRFTTGPATTQHARHTHAIIKNVEGNAPHGHAPDCNLHSANSMDLAAVRWAAQDRGCTVISQSFHRDSEQTSSDLSFDDVYKDHLALHWPYPTICEAAGNGVDSEYVNHKGFNRLTVGNHNDAASAMASDTVFRNPSSPHGDRELPEIAANGVAVTTVGLTFSGTSMAAPAVAGGAALIQQTNATLKSWPEGCRAILLASAWRNPAGGTWGSDLVSGVDGADGAGALDSNAAAQIARNRRSRDGSGTRRGWDVGTVRSADVGADGFLTYVYRITVPRVLLGPRVKVALAWDSHVVAFLGLPLSSRLTVDLDLHVRDSAGGTVAVSASWDNSYEIVEFAAQRGETYEIRIRRWSGSDDVWFGVAWTVTGFDLLLERIENAPSSILGRR